MPMETKSKQEQQLAYGGVAQDYPLSNYDVRILNRSGGQKQKLESLKPLCINKMQSLA